MSYLLSNSGWNRYPDRLAPGPATRNPDWDMRIGTKNSNYRKLTTTDGSQE
jgi:hypothetical protein